MDKFSIKIEKDGTITVLTEDFSRPNHLQADQLMAFLARQLGGEVTRHARPRRGHVHTHGHEHAHEHDHDHEHDHEHE